MPPDRPPTGVGEHIDFVLGGNGIVTVGGEMPGRRTVADRPGEYLGPIRGGRDYAVHAGDVLSNRPERATRVVWWGRG